MLNTKNLTGDLFGGMTAAVVALPLALAFGVTSGAGALAGLYGAILVGFFAALFGGTPTQISGPTGPMTVVMATIVLQFSNNLGQAFLVVFLAGGLQITYGLLGLGRFIKLVPHPVVSGFMTGIGIIVIIIQIAPLFGYEQPDGGTLVTLFALPDMIIQPSGAALALGLLSLAIMLFTPKRLGAYLPPPLVAIFVGTLVQIFWLPEAPVIGEVPSGLPHFQNFSVSIAAIPTILRFAVVLSFLGAIDSLLTSLVADSVTRSTHNSNKELIGQGMGNMAAGLFGGIPGAGATMRTLVNIRAGGRGRASGAIHAVVLLIVVLVFADAAAHIPLAVLAGILIKVGIDIIDWRSLKRIHTSPKSGVVIMLTTLGITVFVDLMTAVAVGIVMASVLFVARMAETQKQSAKFHFGAEQEFNFNDEENTILERAAGKIVVFHVDGPLSFGSARDIARLLKRDLDKDILAIDLSDVPFIDTSASNALEEVIDDLNAIGDRVIIFGASKNVLNTLDKTGVLSRLDSGQIAPDRLTALRSAETYLKTATSNG